MRLSVLHEAYCDACGGWDAKQGGTGHKIGCPVGKTGTQIFAPVVAVPESGIEGGIIEGRFDIGDIEHIYSEIKGYSGVIVKYEQPSPNEILVRIMFDNKKKAEGFNDLVNDPHVIGSDIFKVVLSPTSLKEIGGPTGMDKDALDKMIKRYNSGRIDSNFVHEFDLS
jgi:hypothetical protein